MVKNKPLIEKYGMKWRPSMRAIQIEMTCIRNGGKWKNKRGQDIGLGLYQHYKNFQKLLWPDKVWHRWNELVLKHYCSDRIIGIMGPASSAKTREASDYALCTYFVFPHETTVMISSTDMRSLELRIWGEIKKNWNLAKLRHPFLPGNPIGSRQMLTTDSLEDEVRDFRNGVIGIPCISGGQYVGLSKFVGLKNKRVILIADESQFLPASFFDSISNLSKNPGFQAVALGNPKDREDALGKICEPEGGWDSLDQTEKTKTWRTRHGGVAIQLVGTDSPNFDVPEDKPVPYPFLITRKAISQDIAYYGRDSLQVSMMDLGIMPKDSVSRRVITRSMCQQFGAMKEPVWDGSKITRIAGLDAAYGSVGGDRCVFIELNMGRDVSGKIIIAIKGNPVIVPVSDKLDLIPEDQIASYVMSECLIRGIPPENVFYDSTGRGSLGTAFARKWSAMVNPIEFGGAASDRPVTADNRVLCKDYYSKFVTELWYSVRYAIESEQFRGMTEDVLSEGCMREWKIVRGNRIEIEPKDVTKLRMGKSPDLFDSLVCCVEGARQLGFEISKIGVQTYDSDSFNWLDEIRQKSKRLNKRNTLAMVDK